jgi:hypothetical protein
MVKVATAKQRKANTVERQRADDARSPEDIFAAAESEPV